MIRIIKFIKKLIPVYFKNLGKRTLAFFTWDPWVNRSWSQEGEDQVLRRIFESKPKGFYVDIGAHHPKRFSNTHLFYMKGWNGINIDAMPGSMITFNRDRPRDINIEAGIGLNTCELDFYIFNEAALNGFSKELSTVHQEVKSNHKIERVVKLSVLPLSVVLERHLPKGQDIDFMSVDVEGLDFEVLKSNDWFKYRPRFVLAEILNSSLHEVQHSDIGKLMRDAGYEIYAKCVNTVFFKTRDQN